MNYGSNAKHMVLAVTCYPSKAMQMQWLNILASIFQNIWDPEKMRIKVKRLIASSSGWTKNSIRFSWFNDNSILWRTNLAILARELGFKDFLIFLPGSVQAGPTTLPPLSKMWVPTNGIKSSMVKLRIVLQVKSFSRHR